jgi:hypothetical protein
MRLMHGFIFFLFLLKMNHALAESPCEKYMTMPSEAVKARSFEVAQGDETGLGILDAVTSGGTALDEQLKENRLLLLYVAVEHLGLNHGEDSHPLREAMSLWLASDGNSTRVKSRAALDQLIQEAIKGVKDRQPDPSRLRLASSREKFRELLSLPAKLATLKKIVDHEFTFSTLDSYLMAHHGFHMLPEIAGYQARPWDGVTLNKIEPSQVKINLREFLTFVTMAMEIEDPIKGYSERTGQTIRFILPKFARFMGSTAERLRYLEGSGAGSRWCESPWCKEERRHGNSWARIYQRLTGREPNRDNPNSIADVEPTERGAFAHLVSRMTTEWNASSTYLTFSHQTEGELHSLMMNITRDEIKHLIISSSAYVFLKGFGPWGRFRDLAKTAWYFIRSHQEERSNGQDMISNEVRLIETIYVHALIEMKMRQYLNTLPLSALREIFDGESRIEPKETVILSEEIQRQYVEMEKDGDRKRRFLLWWERRQIRDQALAQEKFEERHREFIARIIRDKFEGFKGAENFESAASEALRQQIARLDIPRDLSQEMNLPRDREIWVHVLSDALRRYQIFSQEARLQRPPP